MELDIYFSRENLRAALFVCLLSVAVLIGLFIYLNRHTRKRYFTLWTVAWAFYAGWITLCFGSFAPFNSSLGLLLKQWCVSFAAVFLMWGSFRFLELPVRRMPFALFISFLAVWSYVGVYHLEGVLKAEAPVFALIALSSWVTAGSFFQARRRNQFLGNTLLVTGFLSWGFFMAVHPFLNASPDLLSAAFFISTVLQVFIAVSMIILVLEQTRFNHQKSLEALADREADTRRLHREMRSMEERYEGLFQQSGDAVIITEGPSHQIVQFNPRAESMLGLRRGDFGDMSLQRFVKTDEAFDAGRGVSWENWIAAQPGIHIVGKNGVMTPVQVSVLPLKHNGTQLFQFLLSDGTPRSKLERQLRQAEKMSSLGQMVSAVAHELNNPLSVVKGYLDLVLARHELNPQTRRDLEKVVQESNRAAKLVRTFLTFAREQPNEKRMIDLNEILERVVELRQIDTGQNGVTLATDLDSTIPATWGDAEQIQQVVMILLNNALHALEKKEIGGIIRVMTRRRGPSILVAVEDNGPGISEEIQVRIFEPFFTTKPSGKGTGLGLSIAHSIVTEHSGTIEYQRSVLGGACFNMVFPVQNPCRDTKTELAKSGDESPASQLTPAANILVLDDEVAVAELLGEFLQALGYQPTVCTSPLKALELIETQRFDLVVSDFRMPVMDGRRFYEAALRKRPELAQKIIFLTGDVASDQTREFFETSGAPHLVKPFQLINVEQFIRDLLKNNPETAAIALK